MVLISTTVDGADHADEVEPRLLLVYYLRTRLSRTGTEAALNNAQAGAGTVDEAAGLAAEGTSPASDLSGQAGYRQHLARVLTRRAVMAAAGM